MKKLLLCGGGGLLEGLDRFLEDELGLPVERYEPLPGHNVRGKFGTQTEPFALASSLAMREKVPRAKRVDLRRGELAFKGDYEFLKRRMGWVAVCVLAILLSWTFGSWTEYTALKTEVEAKRGTLEKLTRDLFGKPAFDRPKIVEQLGGERVERVPIPKKDAFDIVLELSRRIPSTVVHDVDFLEIKPKRTTMRGIVDAELKTETETETNGQESGSTDEEAVDLSPTDLIKQKLDEFKECFTAIRVGKVTSVGDRRRYQMDIDSHCP